MTQSKNRSRGFTLIELLAVVAISAILAAIAAPPMSQFITRNRIASQANDLLSLLAGARMQAIRQRTPVGVCAIGNPKGTADCPNSGDWNGSIAVYAFNALGNRAAADSGTPLPPIRILQAAEDGSVISRSGSTAPIRFGQSGRWLDFAGNANTAFILSSDAGENPTEQRAICLYPSGNSRVIATRSGGRSTGASC